MRHVAGGETSDLRRKSGRFWPRMQTRLRADAGGAALETALVLPAFLMLLLGLMYFALVLFGYCNASHASRLAARYASLHSTTSLAPATTASIQAVAAAYLLTPAGVATTTANWTAGNTVGSTVTVSISVAYTLGIPFSTLTSLTVGSSAQRTVTR